jgi:KipI family sensor histidine kinase inhibitor
VEFADEISPEANALVLGMDGGLETAAIPGIIERIPAYCSLLVEYDPLRLSYAELQVRLAELAATGLARPPGERTLKVVPTAYGGENGPDLAEVARLHGMTPQEAIRQHSETIYTVYMLGFSPGFAYMGLVPEAIATPRLPTPRTRVPAGSVGVAGRQTGIYPQCTPGGWQLVGRTDLPLFDPRRVPPAFFQPGDRVRFQPVGEAFAAKSGRAESPAIAAPPGETAGTAVLEVIAPGLLTTVQDLGRSGYQRLGVPASGAVDLLAMRAANALVGNPAGAAGLEITVEGPTLRFLEGARIAITGADLQPVLRSPAGTQWPLPLWQSVFVRRGSVLECVGLRSGCRGYLAVAGGICLPLVMGSRSTYLPGEFGGQQGRRLQAGDILAVASPGGHLASQAGRWLPPDSRPNYSDAPTVRAVLGPHQSHFGAEALVTLFAQEYQVAAASDRMGLRLQGEPLYYKGPGHLASFGMALGSIQVPPDGQPIVLLADRQTAGGYPVVATVIRADVPLLAQCLPGQSRVRFQAITIEEAQAVQPAPVASEIREAP